MKPERRLTILLVSVKYRISETYPVWPLWWSGWAKQPAGFPWMGPHHTHTEHALNEGFLLCLFGTTMEQCMDYIYFTKRASNISRETHTREGGLYGVRMNSSCYVTERLLGRYFWYSASHKNNFPNLPHYILKDYHVARKMSKRIIIFPSNIISGFHHSMRQTAPDIM